MSVSLSSSRTHGPASAAEAARSLPGPARKALGKRLRTLAGVLDGERSRPLPELLDLVEELVGRDPGLLWLAHSVLLAELPTDEDMNDLLVGARLHGSWAALAPRVRLLAEAPRLREVQVLRGAVTSDVHATAGSDFLSGIQRVVRETARRWQDERPVTLVGWLKDMTALRRLTETELDRLSGAAPGEEPEPSRSTVVVPWESTHLWVEVVTELPRTGRLLAMAQHSWNQVGVLAYDSIPVTSAATVGRKMTSHFVRGLAAARRSQRVALISEAAAEEFRGVLDMGAGRRDRGPEVAAVPLAVSAPATTDSDLAEAAAGLAVDGVPMVLVVGSHEPRKNHLAVLHAAEVLWREGLRFNLVMVGAGSWRAAEFHQTVNGLLADGRPLQSIRGLPDRLLWAAYRLAHCTLFPSLNEGFGLPVAESLAAGTPVITSRYGSMRDIVAPNGEPLGGLLVDPRDDQSIIDALRTMLTDQETYQRLKTETALHPERTWDEFAGELWSFLVDGVAPLERQPPSAEQTA